MITAGHSILYWCYSINDNDNDNVLLYHNIQIEITIYK